MRRSEQYTVPAELYTIPPTSAYQEAFRALPFFQRLYLLVRTWFGGSSITDVVKDHELERVRKRISSVDGSLVSFSIPALKSAFHERLQAVQEVYQQQRRVLAEARGSGAGSFMSLALESLANDLHQSLEASVMVPDALLDDAAATVDHVSETVTSQLHEALDIQKNAITEHLEPVWKALESLAALSTIDFKALVPQTIDESTKTPMRMVADPLARLAGVVDLCVRNRHDRASKIAADFTSERRGNPPEAAPPHNPWAVIEDFQASVPLLDLVRLAMDEPRLELNPITVSSQWWARFSLAWSDSIDVGPAMLSRRTEHVEDELRERFTTSAEVPLWIPAMLFQRSLGALRRLYVAGRFEDARTLSGALAREPDLMPPSERARVLEALVALDAALTKLSELLGSGNARGSVGEELQRIDVSSPDASIASVQKSNLYARFRPELRIILDHVVTALTEISLTLDRNGKAIRSALRNRNLRIEVNEDDLPLIEYLDLATTGFREVGLKLRSLHAVESELIAKQNDGLAGATDAAAADA